MLFKRSFDQAPVGAAMVKIDGHFERANKKMCEILGYSEKELKKLTFLELTHPEDRQYSINKFKSLTVMDIDQFQFDTRYTRSTGEIIWTRLSVRMMNDINTNKPLYFLPIIEDITDRKLAEEELDNIFNMTKEGPLSRAL